MATRREQGKPHEPSQILVYKNNGFFGARRAYGYGQYSLAPPTVNREAKRYGKELGMTDDQRARRINEAAERFAASLIEAYRSVASRSVSTQELNAQLTQGFFDRVIDNLGSHAEGNRVLTEKLIKQQRKQLEASRTLAWESVDAYMDLLGSVFALPHRGGVQTAGRAAQEAGPGSSVEPGGEESEAQRDVARHPLSSWMKDSPGAPG